MFHWDPENTENELGDDVVRKKLAPAINDFPDPFADNVINFHSSGKMTA